MKHCSQPCFLKCKVILRINFQFFFSIYLFKFNTKTVMRPNVTLSHRLLCFILLCVALCFTLIISNIFFDMDAFFSGWIKGHSEDIKYKQKPSENTYKRKKDIINHLFEQNVEEEENVDENYEQLFRNKRSIDFRNGIFPMGTPKNKNVIKKRLNKILEQLEEDDNKKAKDIEGVRRREMNKIKNFDNTNNEEESKGVKNLFSQSYIADKIDMNLQNWSTTIHNAIANTLIQDSLQQMDLKDFFASINNLIKKEERKKDGTTINVQAKIEIVNNKHNLVETDKKVNPQYLKQIVEALNKKTENAKADEIKEKYLETKQYNNVVTTRSVENDVLQIEDCPMIRKHKLYLHKMLEDYLRKFPDLLNNTKNTEEFTNKRVKRETNVNTRDNFDNINNAIKKDNDGLYIEIKTHVDDKRLKDKNKQKIVNNLIAKIERAIYSENELPKEKKKKVTRKHLHIRKRAQHPLNDKTKRESNYNKVSPYSSILPRQLDPIGLAGPKYSTFAGENEGMSDHDLKPELKNDQESDVNRPQKSELIIDSKTIPQRRQMPLVHEELPDRKYFVKNFDGTGFSIGFNQYADEPPDEDSIKLFTGIENLIKEYHRNYDMTDSSSDADYANTNPGLNERFVTVRNKRHVQLSKYYNKKSNNLQLRKNYPHRKILNDYKTEVMKNHLIIDKIIPKYLKETPKYRRLKKALERFLQRKSGYLRPKNLTDSKINKHSNSFVNKYEYLKTKREKRNTSQLGLLLNDFNDEGNSSPFNSSDEAVVIYSDGNLPDSIPMSDLDFQSNSNSSQIFSNENFNDISSSFPGLGGTEIGRYESINSKKKDGTRPEEDALMSKYPHILGSDSTTSNEDTYKVKEIQIENNHTILHTHMTGVDEIINALLPRDIQKTKYNVTVKLTPTNSTEIKADIKEVRSPINKTHNSIVLNISPLSKIEYNNDTNATITAKSDIKNFKQFDLNVRNNEGSENTKIIPQMLEKQKQNIETQIQYLKQEKLHIEKMMHEKNQSKLENNSSDTVKGKRLSSHSTTEANDVTLTTEFATRSTTDPYKTKILATINRHERMTNEILKKMDSHTQLLKNFIETLINANSVAINNKYNGVETKSAHDTTTQNVTTVRELARVTTKKKNDFPKIYFYNEPTPNHSTEVTPLLNDIGKYKTNNIYVKKENNEKNNTNVTNANYYNIGRSLVLKLPSTDYKSYKNKLPPGVTVVNSTKY